MRSWAEWLYFNGRAGETQFYLTFLAGPKQSDGTRTAGVRLQLDRAGVRSSYSTQTHLDEAELLRSAPDLTIGSNRVRLNGLRYEITLDLPREKLAEAAQRLAARHACAAISFSKPSRDERSRRSLFTASEAGYQAMSCPSCRERSAAPWEWTANRPAGRRHRLSRS